MEKEKKSKVKQLITNLIRIALLLLIFFGALIYPCYHFMKQTHKEWDTFDDKRIAEVEKSLHMTMPDDADPVWFRHDSFLDHRSLLIVDGIDDPQEFLEKAFPDTEITEYTTDEEDSSNDNEKKNELQKFSPDSEDFSTIKDRLNSNSALKRSGYTLEFTEIYFFIDDEFSSDIGFGKTDSGYCAVISHISD